MCLSEKLEILSISIKELWFILIHTNISFNWIALQNCYYCLSPSPTTTTFSIRSNLIQILEAYDLHRKKWRRTWLTPTNMQILWLTLTYIQILCLTTFSIRSNLIQILEVYDLHRKKSPRTWLTPTNVQILWLTSANIQIICLTTFSIRSNLIQIFGTLSYVEIG